jgi:methanogenic corrinoid protein MtbC1
MAAQSAADGNAPNMGRTIQAFEEAGLREKVKMMVGGAPVTLEFAEDMGADGYGKDAIACVEKARELLGIKDAAEASVEAETTAPKEVDSVS